MKTELIPISGVVSVRVKALVQLRDKTTDEIQNLKKELECIEEELDLAYQMMDSPSRFKIIRED